MRDTAKLNGFYDELKSLHITHFSQLRFGQLIYNFQNWLETEKGVNDIFYLEEVPLINLLHEYSDYVKWHNDKVG